MRRSFFVCLAVAALLMAACDSGVRHSDEAAAQIENAYRSKNYKGLMELADSLQREGLLSEAEACYWKGYASERQMQNLTAEFFWERAVADAKESKDPYDHQILAKAGSRLANLLSTRGHYESTLKVAVPVAERLEELQCDTTSDYYNLLVYIGCCQTRFNDADNEKTNDYFDRAYQYHVDNIDAKHTDVAYKNAFAGLINIVYNYNQIERYVDALKWNDRYGKIITGYEQRQDASRDYIDKQWARYDIYRAIALEGLGRKEEAAEVYADFLKTAYSKTPEGQIVSNDYLEKAERWKEAAANYESLDKMVDEYNAKYSLENMQQAALKKYRVNLLAGRRDSAMAVSMQISEMLDSAIARARRLDAEQQVVIRKEQKNLAERQETLVRRQMYGLLTALLIAILVFLGYIVYQLWMRYRLAKAHHELKTAYGQVEEAASEKGRQGSEQQIARALMRAIMPEGVRNKGHLSLYATPLAAEADDADFYDYKVDGQFIYFCIGGAEGKGVKASLSSALVMAQLSSMSLLDTPPDSVFKAINATMVASDYTPVDMLIARLDTTTGELLYCNAGNPAPVLASEEIGFLPMHESEALGKRAGQVFVPLSFTLSPKDTLLLYTRTLGDAQDAGHRKFVEKRLLGEALQAQKTDATPEVLVNRILESVQRFTESEVRPLMLAIKYQ